MSLEDMVNTATKQKWKGESEQHYRSLLGNGLIDFMLFVGTMVPGVSPAVWNCRLRFKFQDTVYEMERSERRLNHPDLTITRRDDVQWIDLTEQEPSDYWPIRMTVCRADLSQEEYVNLFLYTLGRLSKLSKIPRGQCTTEDF